MEPLVRDILAGAGVTLVIGFVGWLTGGLRWVWQWIKRNIRVSTPTQTLREVTAVKTYNHWIMGTPEQNGMSVNGECQVTNITEADVAIASVMVRMPHRQEFVGHVEVFPVGGRRHEGGIVGAQQMCVLQYRAWVQPPKLEVVQMLTADVAIVDQYDNKLWLRGETFKNKSPG